MRCQLGGCCLMLSLMLVDIAWAQHAPYSLQAAVDELHRREATKYPLNAPPPPAAELYFGRGLNAGANGAELDYLNEDTESSSANSYKQKNFNRQRLNKALTKYLEHENYEADRDGLNLGPLAGYEFDDEQNNNSNNNNVPTDEKKRSPSLFRERDTKYDSTPISAFRERESQTAIATLPEQQQQQKQVQPPSPNGELTEEFLRAVEEATERERLERYKTALRHLWEKYQQQDNDIDAGAYEEKSKRMRVPPYYMLMQKKRSYPVLPYLPYNGDQSKRFPVSKRSAKRTLSENTSPFGKTDDKVAKELSELFGKPLDGMKKRSTEEQTKVEGSTHVSETDDKQKTSNNETVSKNKPVGELHQHGFGGIHEHADREHKHRKRSDHAHHSHESGEESAEDEHDEHDEDESDTEEDDHDEFYEDEGDESRKKKKKRDTDMVHSHSLPTKFLNARSKKSIDWSQYFGLDRKKKMDDNIMKKRSANDLDGTDRAFKNRNELSPEKLENIDKKLQSIEDFIIDETIKYTGAHEGITTQDEIRSLKDHVLSRLATAYSLEKMRRALEKLRQSVEKENHLLRNVIESDSDENAFEKIAREADENDNDHAFDARNKATAEDNNSDDAKEKKKRNSYLRYPALSNNMEDDVINGQYEALNDAYLGNKNYIVGTNQCPLIEAMAQRCRGVDVLSGDINQELLPLCGVHQICYLCGTSRIACDYQYLDEADIICGDNGECSAAARSVLMILRGTPGPQLGPRECTKNSCLYSAMREIGL